MPPAPARPSSTTSTSSPTRLRRLRNHGRRASSARTGGASPPGGAPPHCAGCPPAHRRLRGSGRQPVARRHQPNSARRAVSISAAAFAAAAGPSR
ncbi:MAG: hypothetical protein EOL89_11125 [Actinobacteria bacterium]|nr:hypothetical protein [Actinomycetota bacterium]